MMSLDVTPVLAASTAVVPPNADWDPMIVRLVERLTRQAQQSLVYDRRQTRRLAFPRPVRLTPVARDSLKVTGSDVLGMGRSVARRGLDFYHLLPLPSRYVLASFDEVADHPPLLLDVRWSRFLKQGWYLSGGRFLNVLVDSRSRSTVPTADRISG